MTDRMGYKKAAGIKVEKRRPGRPAGDKPKKSELQRLYVKEGRSIRGIAEILGCSKDLVYRALEEYGIARRPQAKRSKLRKYSLGFIREEIKKEGTGKTAEKLGVHRQILWEYLREREPHKKS